MITPDTYYEAYAVTMALVQQVKDQMKTLQSAAQSAGEQAKRETVGSIQEKLTAIRTAMQPFKDAITEADTKQIELQTKGDALWRAYELSRISGEEAASQFIQMTLGISAEACIASLQDINVLMVCGEIVAR